MIRAVSTLADLGRLFLSCLVLVRLRHAHPVA